MKSDIFEKMGHKRNPKNIVFFEEEVIKKDEADGILSRLKETDLKRKTSEKQQENEVDFSKREKKKRKKMKKLQEEVENEIVNGQKQINQEFKAEKRKKKKVKHQDESTDSQCNTGEENDNKKVKKSKKIKDVREHIEEEPPKKSKKRKHVEEDENQVNGNNTEENNTSNKEDDIESAKKPKPESKRSLKRKKHAKLLEEKKLKAELNMQHSVLNYLSKWKHARSDWKFEKLKQIWLQQNLFIVDKLPEEYWSTVVEYLNGSKGATRKIILKGALKIIEEEDIAEAENDDEDYQTKLRRARDVLQSLEE